MLNRRTLLATSASAAILAALPSATLAKPTPPEPPLPTHRISGGSGLDKAIHLLRSLGFDHKGMVTAFHVGAHAPRTAAELRDIVTYYAVTKEDADMRFRVRILAWICDVMDRKYDSAEHLRAHLESKTVVPYINGMYQIGSGSIPHLKYIAHFV